MDINLHEKAQILVIKEIKNEKQEEFNERVREKYNHLKFESEHIKASPNIIKKIKSLKEKSKDLFPLNWSDSMSGNLSSLKSTIKKYLKTGIYHPRELKQIEPFEPKNS